MIDKIRYSLIKLIAGKKTIAINLTIRDGILKATGEGFIYNTIIETSRNGMNVK